MFINANIQAQKNTSSPNFGSRKIPRFLYHFTTEKGYQSILKGGSIRSRGINPRCMIFMVDLQNFIKYWKNILYSYKGPDSLTAFLLHLKDKCNANEKIILLKIPTKHLKRANLKIRSRKIALKNVFEQTLEEREHISNGVPAIMAKTFIHKKHPIEYIYQDLGEKGIQWFEKIGEVGVAFNPNEPIPFHNLFLELLKNTPEAKANALWEKR